MGEFGFELEEIARLIRLVETRGLTELIVESEGRRIAIRGIESAAPAVPAAAGTGARAPYHAVILPSGASAEALSIPVEALEGKTVAIESPTVGVYYRSPGSDQPPYVEPGDHIEAGQIVGLLEAMKVFSEIPSELSGTVTRIAVSNGQLVRTGEPLLYLIPD